MTLIKKMYSSLHNVLKFSVFLKFSDLSYAGIPGMKLSKPPSAHRLCSGQLPRIKKGEGIRIGFSFPQHETTSAAKQLALASSASSVFPGTPRPAENSGN